VKKDELGRACSTHRSDVKCIQSWVGKPEGDHLQDTDMNE
jgi:hypothetical protein